MGKKIVTHKSESSKVSLSYDELMQMTTNGEQSGLPDDVTKGLEEESLHIEMSADAIPDDITKYLEIMENMVSFMTTPDMMRLEIDDNKKFETIVSQRYNQILPMSMINMLLEPEPVRGEHVEQLIMMFEQLEAVKLGNADVHTQFEIFNNRLKKQYNVPDLKKK
jgi:hypothetical protein